MASATQAAPTSATPILWTIGHSTRPWDEFVLMLAEAGITAVVDVRRFAGSRRNPQFSGEAMARALPAAGIAYLPVPELGGRRTPRPDTVNLAWRNAGFRGYADYMESDDYQLATSHLADLAEAQPTVVMCAEAVWWRCHRSLIADDFKARGWQVVHLIAPGRSDPHPYTPAARIVEGRLDYRAAGAGQGQPGLF